MMTSSSHDTTKDTRMTTDALPGPDDAMDVVQKWQEEWVYNDVQLLDRCAVAELVVALRPDLRDAIAGAQSLCPVHLIDAAICYDDDNEVYLEGVSDDPDAHNPAACRDARERVFPGGSGYDT
jgi:hypothetical protein